MKKSKIVFWILAVLLAMVLVLAVFSVGIYQLGWESQATRAFLRVIPLPAVVINGRIFVPLFEILERRDAYEHLVEYQASSGISPRPEDSDLAAQKQQVVLNAVEDKVVVDLAKRANLTVTQSDLDRYVAFLLGQFGIPAEQGSQEIEKVFGMTLSDFKEKIVLPDLMRTRLQINFLAQAKDSAQYLQATKVGSELGRGLSFEEAILKYSEDETSKYIAGDLGFMSLQNLPQWISDPVSSLNDGQVSPLVVTPDGYHYFEVASRDEAKDPVQINLRHIFIAGKGFDEYFAQQRQQYQVLVFGKLL